MSESDRDRVIEILARDILRGYVGEREVTALTEALGRARNEGASAALDREADWIERREHDVASRGVIVIGLRMAAARYEDRARPPESPSAFPTCPDCHHAQHEHERPYGCSRCACENGYWGGEDE